MSFASTIGLWVLLKSKRCTKPILWQVFSIIHVHAQRLDSCATLDPLVYLKLSEGKGFDTTANIGSYPVTPILAGISNTSWIIGKGDSLFQDHFSCCSCLLFSFSVDYALRFNTNPNVVQSIALGLGPANIKGVSFSLAFWARGLVPHVQYAESLQLSPIEIVLWPNFSWMTLLFQAMRILK